MEKDKASGSSSGRSETIDGLLDKLTLHEEGDEVFVFENEISKQSKARWLASARVLRTRGFNQCALFPDMRAAWNPAQEVKCRRVDENLFTLQFNCLAEWNKVMNLGPWLFKGQVLLMVEYDGFTDPSMVKLNK